MARRAIQARMAVTDGAPAVRQHPVTRWRMVMHVQVVNFQLRDMDEGAFRAQCDELAETFAAIPDLIAKLWLADAASGTYGGVYTWENKDAYEAYTRSDLFNAVATNPHFANVTSRDFGVLDGPTRVTRGLVAAAV
jgi:quinol monooxygenase YgiN